MALLEQLSKYVVEKDKDFLKEAELIRLCLREADKYAFN